MDLLTVRFWEIKLITQANRATLPVASDAITQLHNQSWRIKTLLSGRLINRLITFTVVDFGVFWLFFQHHAVAADRDFKAVFSDF